MSDVAADVRLAIRSLRSTPTISLAALLTLTLGIGAITAIFAVADALILRPLPVAEPQRLVTITSETALRFGFQAGAGWNFVMWDQFRQRTGAFDGAFAWTVQRLELTDAAETEPVQALVASGNVFSTLGVRAVVGRTFTDADDVRGGGRDGLVGVISYDLWRRRFNANPAAIGSRLIVERTPVTIVGVAPQRFRGLDVGQPFDIAIPFGAEPIIHGRRSLLDNQGALLLTVMLRLRPGQTLSQATAILRAMQPQIVPPRAPKILREPFVVVSASTGISDRSRLRQQYESPLVALSVVAGLVLVIVCANVAHLFLARATARRRDLSIRLAIGASRSRILRLLAVEVLLVGALGAGGALVVSAWASRGLVALLPAAAAPVFLDLTFDWRVLIFSLAVTLFAVFVFSIGPVLYATRVPSIEALQDAGRSVGAGRTSWLSNAILVTQLAVAIVLLAAAGVFVRTLNRLASVPLGFDPTDVTVISVNVTRPQGDLTARLPLYDRIVEAIAAVPGVEHAAGSIWTPIGAGGGLLTDARGRRADIGRHVAFNFVTPGWFATYGIPIRSGRDFDGHDGAGGSSVAVINEALRRSLPGTPAAGETIEGFPCIRGCTVVGIVSDSIYGHSPRDGVPPTVYLPLARAAGQAPPEAALRVSVRTAGDVARVIPSVRSALRGMPDDLTFTFRPLDADIKASVAQERLTAVLAGWFGVVGLCLAAVGLYGLTAYGVSRRRGEIGVRLALGATAAAVMRLVLTRVIVLVLLGIAIGIIASLWLSRFIAPLLFGLQPQDPVTLTGATIALGLVSVVSGWIPAWRAGRLDPAQVLRQQ
jgi:putative ABC transport system permease protein